VSSCAHPPADQVVVYVSTDPHVALPILEQFTAVTGIEVVFVGDTEAKKTTGLVERLRMERDRPIADVFWSSEAMQTISLAEEDVLATHADERFADWPAEFRDPEGRWYGFSPRPRVLVYHSDRLDPQEVPATWEGVLEARWKGRVVLADPRFGTTGGHLGAMLAAWTARSMPARFDAMVDGLAANEVRILPGGNAAVVDAVLRGEADLGFTDADDVRAAQRSNLPLAMVYARHELDDTGGGTFLMPNTVSIVRGAPHREHAERLLAYLLSDDVARALAESVSGNMPLQPLVAEEYPELAVADPLKVDLVAASACRVDAVNRLMRAVRAMSDRP
jgi:iron(III) transport system substrate-binding protein